MDRYSYTCQNCGKDYIPNRRGVQKYCSNSCRTRAFLLRKSKLNLPSTKVETQIEEKQSTKIDKMSVAGVGNAVVGTTIVKLAEAIFTNEANKPATKNDIKNLEAKISKRYYLIKNMQKDNSGRNPYFDTVQSCVVYF